MRSKRKDFYLMVYDYIQKGINPKKICELEKISKQRLNYYLSSLKKQDLIKKIGYGTWIINPKKQVKTSKKEVTDSNKSVGVPFARLHRVQISLPIRQWVKPLQFDGLPVVGAVSYHVVKVKGIKVKVFDKVLDCYVGGDFVGNSRGEAQLQLLNFLKVWIVNVEKELSVKVRRDFLGGFDFVVSGSELANVGHPVALHHSRKREKFRIVDKFGELRMVIDKSLKVPELEFVKRKKSGMDYQKVVDELYPDVLSGEWRDLKLLKKDFYSSMKLMGDNFRSHVSLVKEIKGLIKELRRKK